MNAKARLKLGGVFKVECRDRHGNLKWKDTAKNVVTDTGIIYVLNTCFSGGTAVTTWRVGLLASTDVTTTDIMSGISEATEYSESTRPIWVEGRTNKTVSNTGNLATFSINADATTIEGAFLASSKTAGGTAGILFSGAPFTGGSKTGDSGDALRVTYTLTGADA